MEDKLTEYNFDPFTLHVDASGDVEKVSIMIINTLLQTNCNIHVINYTSFNIEAYLKAIIEANKNELLTEKFGHIIFVNEVRASRAWLNQYTKNLDKNDVIYIHDIRRLISLPRNSENLLTTIIGDETTTVYFEAEENWQELIAFLDSYYKQFLEKIYGVISAIYTDSTGYANMYCYLKNTNNMSITITESCAENTSILDPNEIKKIITTS